VVDDFIVLEGTKVELLSDAEYDECTETLDADDNGNGFSKVSRNSYSFALDASVEDPHNDIRHPRKLPVLLSSSWSDTRMVQLPTGSSPLSNRILRTRQGGG
jgi:hypothetical protein